MNYSTMTPAQIIDASQGGADLAAQSADSVLGVLRALLQQERPDPRTVAALAADYAHHAREEHTARAVARAVLAATS